MRLTEKAIGALTCPAGSKDRLVFDDLVPCLGVRVSAGGNKAFLAQYTTPAGRRRVPLGRWGAITLEQARVAARAVLGDVAKGQDPAEARKATRVQAATAKASAALTLAVLLEQWASLALADRRESYRREALRALRHAFAAELAKPAAALTRTGVVETLDPVTRTRPAIAGRTVAYGRACYAWAQRRGMVAGNPFAELPIRAGVEARDRVLTEEEVALAWMGMDALGEPFGPLLRVLLLTAQRREEVAGMRWSEVSADGATWVIPKERAKNGRAHAVHLAPAVRAILSELSRVEGAELVFSTTGRTAVSGFSRAKLRLDAAMAELRVRPDGTPGKPVPAWRLHDFRRTAVTWLAGQGFPPHVCDRLLNHVSGAIQGVAAVYQRAEFLAERKAALEAWAARVTGQG